MKKTIKLLALAALVGCAQQANETVEVPKYTINQFYENVNVGGGSFSPDESKLLINSNESGIYNVYEIDIATGEKTQMTNSTEESYFGQSYFPNDNRFVYSFDEGGNENFQSLHDVN